MTGQEIAFAGLLITILGAQGGMLRWLVTKMREDREESLSRDDHLHSRINEVKDSYVRRDDLLTHLKNIEKSQDTMATAIDRIHVRFDRMIGKNGSESA